jgi:Fusaric acid resistance protein-like
MRGTDGPEPNGAHPNTVLFAQYLARAHMIVLLVRHAKAAMGPKSAHMFRSSLREVSKFDSSKLDLRTALSCLPAIAAPLIAGFWLGQREGLVAAGGAMSVGFGSWQRISRSRIAPLLCASFGMAVAAAVGTLVGNSGLSTALTVGAWGFLCGVLWALDAGAWWVSLQCAIALLIAAAFSGGLAAAGLRACLVLTGGLLQTLCALILRPEAGEPALGAQAPRISWRRPGLRRALRRLRPHLASRSPALRYAVRLALTLGSCAGATRSLNIRQWYWVPMTALLVLKPDLQQTLVRGFARIAGTLAGAALATLVAAALRPSPAALVALVLVSAALCYVLLNVNYAAYAIAITAYVAFLLALVGLPELAVVRVRVVNTALGGLCAFLGHFVLASPGPRRSSSPKL